MQRHTLETTRTAHYATLGTPGPHIQHIWIVCHGYAQLAHKFILDFMVLERDDVLVLAPEGLSRFYWGGFHGPVVASWMTSGDRLLEIADYCRYLTALYQHYIPLCSPAVHITLLGFSQGCATQVRWIMQDLPHFHRLILWAGTLPEDLDYAPQQAYWADKDIHAVYGTDDPFISADRLAFAKKVIEESGLNVQEHHFAGVHEMNSPLLLSLANLNS